MPIQCYLLVSFNAHCLVSAHLPDAFSQLFSSRKPFLCIVNKKNYVTVDIICNHVWTQVGVRTVAVLRQRGKASLVPRLSLNILQATKAVRRPGNEAKGGLYCLFLRAADLALKQCKGEKCSRLSSGCMCTKLNLHHALLCNCSPLALWK